MAYEGHQIPPLRDSSRRSSWRVPFYSPIWFDDTDEESALYQAKTLALVEVPLWAVVPLDMDGEIEGGTPAPTNDNGVE
jgi:hypothetical protein